MLVLDSQRFGSWVVAWPVGYIGRTVQYLCFCDCGKFSIVASSALRRGSSTKCRWCHNRVAATTHGASSETSTHHREYRAYCDAKKRCTNPKSPVWKDYGGRGIEFLFASFEQWLTELGPRPSAVFSVDRFPNNDGNYEPGNVRWATRSEQQHNKRRAQ